MPFIWNDTDFEFLDENESFNTAKYVIARKLFVKFVPASKVSHEFISFCVNPFNQIFFKSRNIANCSGPSRTYFSGIWTS